MVDNDHDLIKWDPAVYATGVDEMDAQHRRLFDIVNELNRGINTNAGDDVVSRALDRLVDYAKTHLSDEEKVMQTWGYPDFDAHKQIHDDLLEKVGKLYGDLKAGHGPSMFLVLGFLRDWLDNHIRKEDHRYGDFILARQASGGGNGSSRGAANQVINLDDDFSHF